jgi:hypothetical protein
VVLSEKKSVEGGFLGEGTNLMSDLRES